MAYCSVVVKRELSEKNLIENNKIDAIIGLPANIFFGTGIPTIIMVLRQKRERTDVLIIDASKGFVKEGKIISFVLQILNELGILC